MTFFAVLIIKLISAWCLNNIEVYNDDAFSSTLVFANSKLKEIKYTGYVGKIKTFGEPFVRHGDIAKITSKKFPEQDGYYSIVGVNYNMSVGDAYKQVVDIGRFIGSSVGDVNVFKQTSN